VAEQHHLAVRTELVECGKHRRRSPIVRLRGNRVEEQRGYFIGRHEMLSHRRSEKQVDLFVGPTRQVVGRSPAPAEFGRLLRAHLERGRVHGNVDVSPRGDGGELWPDRVGEHGSEVAVHTMLSRIQKFDGPIDRRAQTRPPRGWLKPRSKVSISRELAWAFRRDAQYESVSRT
jgi:hypothetical protein